MNIKYSKKRQTLPNTSNQNIDYKFTFKSAGQEKEQKEPSLAPSVHDDVIGDGMYHPVAHPSE